MLKHHKIKAKKIPAPEFNKPKLKELIPKLKSIMAKRPDNFLKIIQNKCLSAGVKVIYTPNLKQTMTNGIVRWIGNNPVIQMTDKHNRYDIFWFSFFHELAHIILHGNKKNIFLEEAKSTVLKSIQEIEADNFSANILLKEEEYQQIMDTLNSGAAIFETLNEYAMLFKTHPDIILGRILFKNENLYKFGLLQSDINSVDFMELIG